VSGLCGLVWVGCSNAAPNGDAGALAAANNGDSGGSTGATATGAQSLVGTWDLLTTDMGSTGSVPTTVAIGQDSLTVTSPDFVLTATRTGNALTFTDEQDPGDPGQNEVLTATQTPATFNTGILPFDLGGSWTMQVVPAGQSVVETCTLTVSAAEIDGACQGVGGQGFDFNFTTKKMTSAASSLGDFGGTWINTWTWPGASGGTYPCELDFVGNGITTCAGGTTNGAANGSPLTGITFTYDGANTASGAAQGWAEYSATRR
jgi:hypothetical protein